MRQVRRKLSQMNGLHTSNSTPTEVPPSLAGQLASALTKGLSVLVTGPAGTMALLAEAVPLLIASRTRVLRVCPPYQLTAFMQQVASSISETDDDLPQSAFDALTALDATCDRIALLVEDAHLLPDATLRYIESAFYDGSSLCVAFAGQPAIADILTSQGFSKLRRRLSLTLVMPKALLATPLPVAAHPERGDQGSKLSETEASLDAAGVSPSDLGRQEDIGLPMEQHDGIPGDASKRWPTDRHSSFRSLKWFWGGVLAISCAGVVTLQLLGPPPHSNGQSEVAQISARAADPQLGSSSASALTASMASTSALPDAGVAPQKADLAATYPARAESTVAPEALEPDMLELAEAAFQMGSNDDASERPPHIATVAPFLLARKATTVREWQQCVEAKACTYLPHGRMNEPVTNVSWDDARQYVAWLSEATMQPYRLPTEAEWEYAARAGASTRYPWGDVMMLGRMSCKGCGEPASLKSPPPVDAYPPNGFGFYGMGGGAAEWVADCWHRSYQGAPRNGSAAWDAPDCRERVLRGGSWVAEASALRVSSRDYYDASVRYPTHGFRVARSK